MESQDENRLDYLSKIALQRMSKHESKMNLKFDRVMVFPQGKFSKEAIKALEMNRYKAAVNSTVYPNNYSGNYTLRDLLNVAVFSDSRFPLFRRRYPKDLFDFATDLLFEKPLFIVQHHQDFKNGFEYLSNFFNSLNKIEPNLSWEPLGQLIDNCAWTKDGDDTKDVFFSKEFLLKNGSS